MEKKIYHDNTSPEKAGVAILISDKVDSRTKNMTREKESHFVMIKASNHLEDTTVLNVYAPNSRVSKYAKQNMIDW